MNKYIAEFIGTFWLVVGGCGSAVLAAVFTSEGATIGQDTYFPLGISLVGVSLAFGLTVLTMAYTFGNISGCHLNPAVSFGLWAGKRFSGSQLLPYIVAQVLGGILGGFIVWLIASGNADFSLTGSNPLATNGYGVHSPAGYPLWTCLITEIVMTFMFLIIIFGATDLRTPAGFAPISIGMGLTLIHLISIPVTNTSVNPARSTGVAVFAGTELIAQLWLFWVAPIVGAILAGWVYNKFFSVTRAEQTTKQALTDRDYETKPAIDE
ncbi:aquaporin Z [Myxosarcina sp. GI1]|uniref:aquaporin Z n=1 Tax=Myxosarcina sp. GI1 TaxID=1541065 RepID=UPI000568D8D4|nr:aquaporin Z [Myxosarcina sp. GI1]